MLLADGPCVISVWPVVQRMGIQNGERVAVGLRHLFQGVGLPDGERDHRVLLQEHRAAGQER